MKAPPGNPTELFLSGVLPEEGSPPPSSTPDIKIETAPTIRSSGQFRYGSFSFALVEVALRFRAKLLVHLAVIHVRNRRAFG